MYKKILGLLFVPFFLAQATDTVRDYDYNSPEFYFTTSTGTYPVLGESQGDGSSETAALKLYLPFEGPTSENNYLDRRATVSIDLPSGTVAAADILKFHLKVTTSTDKYLYIATKNTAITGDSSNYEVVARFSGTVISAGSTNQEITFNLDLKTLCDSNFICPNTASSEAKTLGYVYFFLHTSSVLGSDPFNPADAEYSGGAYYNLNMSNSDTAITTNITNVRTGDDRLIVDYTTSSTLSNFYKMVLFCQSGGTCAATTTASCSANVKEWLEYFPNSYSGKITVRPTSPASACTLQNNTAFNFYLGILDKYYLVHSISSVGSGTPQDIEELLKKQACFILTAGFGEEHPVVEYFRFIRDHYMKNSVGGVFFIKAYYKVGPYLAHLIYPSEKLRFLVRMFAYLGFYMIKLIWLFPLFILGLLLKKSFKSRKAV